MIQKGTFAVSCTFFLKGTLQLVTRMNSKVKKEPHSTAKPRQFSTGLPSNNYDTFVGLFTRKQVAHQLDTCVHTVARYTKRGLLPAIVLGPRLIRYKAQDVEKFIQSGVTGNGGGK